MELSTKVDLLKKQLAEETKEKYALYKRIKELTEEVNMLSEKIQISEKKRLQTQKSMV
tara:strand:- start:242 stop:415 length:174 start_codon:yes stop_codon:yes gene_type:complete